MKLETDLRRVYEVMTRPDVFRMCYADLEIEDYVVDPTSFYFVVGDGLVIYERKGFALEMLTAIRKGDLPDNPIKKLKDQWKFLASLGFYSVYSIVTKENSRASFMCRSAGMDKVYDDGINVFSKVIHG
jgi:hypothetical protein